MLCQVSSERLYSILNVHRRPEKINSFGPTVCGSSPVACAGLASCLLEASATQLNTAPPNPNNKRVLEDFIEIYRNHPFLWKTKSKEYQDQAKTQATYELLIKRLKQIEQNADKAAVVKKINNLRSNVRKEKKNNEQYLESGTFVGDVYHIKLWNYELLDFINDQATPRDLDSDSENSREGRIRICIYRVGRMSSPTALRPQLAHAPWEVAQCHRLSCQFKEGRHVVWKHVPYVGRCRPRLVERKLSNGR
nr:unnamed protein product [Callosobruchus analis]